MSPQALGTHLTPSQREIFRSVLATLAEEEFDRERLHPLLPVLVETFANACAGNEDRSRMADELREWVRRYRVPAFWLTYLFQLALQQQGDIFFVVACRLFAEAQIALNQDLALSSLENGYNALTQLHDKPGMEALKPVADDFVSRMRDIYRYYRQWFASTSSSAVNQLTEHLYGWNTWIDLGESFPALRKQPTMVTPTDYLMVIAACEEPWRIHDRVLARRFLGSCYQGAGDHASALEQFSLALTDATSADIEAEIGHLLRLRGQALGQLGRLDDAVADLRRATAHEAHPLCAYWQAISLRELGDAFLRKAPREVDPAHPPEMLGFALQAYRAGRALFDAQVSSGIVPVARAVEQQMFRSYADNAVQVAMLENPRDLIAEIEAAGPRSATDLIAEGRAAKAQLSTGDAAFREARAIFGEDFLLFTEHGDLEHDFAAYLGNVGTYRVERRRYLQNRLGLTAALTQAQSSDVITERILALRIPGVVILNFHLGREQTFFTVIDAASGQVACAFAAWSEDERHACDNAYAAARASAAAAPTALQRNLLMRRAVNDVLEAYESALAPAFAGLMPLLAGKHVKIIPRFAMSNVPLHALRCAGKPLIASCDVSYAPTLGALLQIHHEEEPFPNNDLLIVRDAKRTPAYAGTLRAIDAERDATIDILADTTRADFMARLIEAPPRDLFFACHGRYDPDNPRTSILQLSATESVPFSTLFADPAIPACRSVMMGACESGLGRTLVSSESIGLPLAFLAAGARYAIGSLWQVNQIASAVLTAEFYRMLRGEARTPTNALNEAQRHILRMTREDVILWLRSNVPEKAEDWEQVIRTMEDPPFENPFFWAGFSITGDI